MDRIRRIQAGNNLIFAILNNYMQQMEEQDEEVRLIIKRNNKFQLILRHFPPPVYQPNNQNTLKANTLKAGSLNGHQY